MSTSAEAEPAPLLRVDNLHTRFATEQGPLRAVDGVSFDLGVGETFGIVGESGSGKSALVRTIMNLLPASARVPEGRVLFDGRDVRALSPLEAKHFWGTEMAMVFQDPSTSLNPVKKIGAQVTESMRYHLGLSKAQATARALDLLAETGISEPRRRLDQYPHELSGGMRQRVMIAIALACEPRLLVADEPTTALDVTVQKQILELLARLQREHGMAMILISHDFGVVSGMADRIAVMYAGQFVESAPAAETFQDIKHPYTEALLSSIPRFDHPSHTRLLAIGGRPPNMVTPPAGCRFAPRCGYADDSCTGAPPPLASTDSDTAPRAASRTHQFRCIHPVTSSPRVARRATDHTHDEVTV